MKFPAESELKKLGLATEPGKVLEAVAHLSQGGSLYALYKGGWKAKMAKGTARKIKRLLNEGKLDFLLDKVRSRQAIEQVWPVFGETDAERQAREKADETEHAAELHEALTEVHDDAPWEQFRDGWRFHRLEVVEEAEKLVSEEEWSVAGMEKAGVPKDKVLGLLTERDSLHFARIGAEVSSAPPPERWMRDFPGIARYMALHYLVAFSRQHPEAPFDQLELAADLYAKGSLEVNNRLEGAGRDILRYEIWRGGVYLEAFFEVQKRYYGTRRSLERFRKRIEPLILSPGQASTGQVKGR